MTLRTSKLTTSITTLTEKFARAYAEIENASNSAAERAVGYAAVQIAVCGALQDALEASMGEGDLASVQPLLACLSEGSQRIIVEAPPRGRSRGN